MSASEVINNTGNKIITNYRIWFFAGGETTENRFNIFTGSFIRLMSTVAGKEFRMINGIYHRMPLVNVINALNLSQHPVNNFDSNVQLKIAYKQIINDPELSDSTQVILISSSSGSVFASQVAFHLAEENSRKNNRMLPFHLVLGACMVSKESELYKGLATFRDNGIIGELVHDEVQDEGDNAVGVGGISRAEAYRNALSIAFPFFSGIRNSPSFLNTHPENGHIHRVRSQKIEKAFDYIRIILIEKELAGKVIAARAKALLEKQPVIL